MNLVKDTPIIVVTGVGDEEVTIRAWRGGAYDYIIKDIDLHYLQSIPKAIKNAIEHKNMEDALDRKQKNLEAIFDAAPVGMLLVGSNMIVARVNNSIKQIVKKSGLEPAYRHLIKRQSKQIKVYPNIKLHEALW